MPSRGARSTVWAVPWLCALALGCVPARAADTPVWTRWGHTLQSNRDYAAPLADVDLRVTYQGPAGQRIEARGFWDGGRAFRVRCMFPDPGLWQWETECSVESDTGLHGRKGIVSVLPYEGGNPLYAHGALRTALLGPCLEHADGTPFLWIGDTAWAAPMLASDGDWATYLADRRAKGFSVTQVFCASDWAGERDAEGNPPFEGEGIAAPNPAYWRGFDRKAEAANQAGIAVLVVGLMEPRSRYPDLSDAERFARFLAARLAGNHVILSPSFDSPHMDLGDAVGEALLETDPVHLIAQHPGTDLHAARTYQEREYTDIAGLQTGAGWGTDPISPETAARNAVEWTLDLRGRDDVKPIVVLEARYDNGLTQTQMPRLPRSCAWWSLLSGACGYTYGCAGVWNWSAPLGDPQSKPWTWREGLDQESSRDMARFAGFLGRLDWWTLSPRHELILEQPEEASRHMVLALGDASDWGLAYLPGNSSIRLRMDALVGPVRASWFDPGSGSTLTEEGAVANSGEHEFARPDGWGDAVLLLGPAEHD